MALLDSARAYFDVGWTAIPLGLTPPPEPMPKRPLTQDWPQTPHDWDVIKGLPWQNAVGLGIVLGAASDNLAVIDFDDVGFADELFGKLSLARKSFYGVRTGRNRGHLYFRTGTPTQPHNARYTWQGRSFSVELKGTGQQVAAPPTPGYSLCGPSTVPTPVGTLGEAWEAIAHSMGSGLARVGGETAGAGYGRAWEATVAEGERNNRLFVEGCRLAEAGMPFHEAVSIMVVRVEKDYGGTMSEREVQQTIENAYRRIGNKPKARGGVRIP